MIFVFFLILLWAMGLYYTREHRRYLAELKALAPELAARGAAALEGRDWRLVRQEEGAFVLLRAFEALRDRETKIRYFVPGLFFAGMLFVLQYFPLALGYLALCVVKWLFAETHLQAGARPSYSIRIFGSRVLSEEL